MQLPEEFEEYTAALMGPSLYATLKQGLSEAPPVSIRLNPFKHTGGSMEETLFNGVGGIKAEPVPWCHNGYYLSQRPEFTFDPLFHAGAYYVQEASSMFVGFVIKQLVHGAVRMLDLCAAPGGKTTCAMSELPEGSLLYANEPIHTRANILAENVMKFGHPDIVVTNNYAADYARAGMMFDVVLADVPCSGEGMFRKDPGAIGEWSTANVRKCQQLQRTIVADVWPCLRPGGMLIYSTCTFNALENEDNIQWIADTLGAQPVTLEGIKDEWNITGHLKGSLPAYRFIPGRSRGEGLFMAVLMKTGDERTKAKSNEKALRVLSHGINPPMMKGKKAIPDISLALSIDTSANKHPIVGVDRPTAISYLRREAITLPSGAPCGIVTIAYKGLALGFANNLGTRANNLYPQQWKIKSTHTS